MLKAIVATMLVSDTSAYFTKDKKCADQYSAVAGRTGAKLTNNQIRTALSSYMDGDNFDVKMIYRDDVDTWGSDCNARRITMKDSTTDLTFKYYDRAYYWWLFFSYWSLGSGNVKCTDTQINKCIRIDDMNGSTYSGNTNWFFMGYGLQDYRCLNGFFGGKEEIISVFTNIKVPSGTTTTASTKTDAEIIADYQTLYNTDTTTVGTITVQNTFYFPDWKKDSMKKLTNKDCVYKWS